MVTSCLVCHEPVARSAAHCPKCGFPAALGDRLVGPITLPETEPAEAPAERTAPVPKKEATASLESEENASLARALQERMELLRTIDRDPPDATGALCEAALSEASGRIADAEQVLRSAQEHLDSETEELLARHFESLESRGRTLETTGLRLALDDELGHLAETIASGDTAASVAAVVTSERRMDGIEAHWRGLQALFAQVATLRDQAAALGIDVGPAPDRLEAARAGLTTMPVTEHELDVAAQAAAETLMHLHEAIPPALEQELAQHASRLEGHPLRSSSHHSARQLHAEAVQHLKGGRLEDAVRSVRDLRAALEDLAKEAAAARAAPPPPPPAPGPPPKPVPAGPGLLPPRGETIRPARAVGGREVGAEAGAPAPAPTPSLPAAHEGRDIVDARTLGLLTRKARSLAVRVRSLPPESRAAAEAAREIHEATELLRARRYAEADAALTRLMRLLAAGGHPS